MINDLSVFGRISTLSSNVDDILLAQMRNEISFSAKRDFGDVSFAVFRKTGGPNSEIQVDLRGETRYRSSEVCFCAESPKSAAVLVKSPKLMNDVDLSVSAATQETPLRIPAKIKTGNYLFSVGATLNQLKTHVSCGLAKDRSIKTRCFFGVGDVTGAILSSATENTAELTGLALHNRGPLFSVGFDVASKKLRDVKIGFASESLLIVGDLLKRGLAAETVFPLGRAKAALRTSLSSADPLSLSAGLSLVRNTKFTIKVDENGRLQMETVICPKENVRVKIGSETCASTAFDPVNFSWSLLFDF